VKRVNFKPATQEEKEGEAAAEEDGITSIQ
jgi:hypothetical protein